MLIKPFKLQTNFTPTNKQTQQAIPQSKAIPKDQLTFTHSLPTEIISQLKNPKTGPEIINKIEKITSKEDKVQFIKNFCKETGFPKLDTVSKKIEDHTLDITEKAAKESNVKVLYSGYNSTCSVGKNCALPGSDIDTWFTIIDGTEEEKGKFLGKIQELANPLLLSVTKSRTDDYPDAITKKEFLESLKVADDIFKASAKLQKKVAIYENNLNNLYEDWTKAGEFNIDFARSLKNDKDKTPIAVRAALVTEIMRNGKPFIQAFEKADKDTITNSCLYKYSNTQQMKMHKSTLKDKHLRRLEEAKKFNDLNTDEKFNLIKNIIALTFKDNRNKLYTETSSEFDQNANLFKSYACGNMGDMFKYLLSKEHGGID